jgi:predicted PurR-regulated permease PerM
MSRRPDEAPTRDEVLLEGPAASGMVSMTVGPQVVAVVLAGIAVGLAAFGVATAASRILGWAVAAAVVAALLEPPVRVMSRHIPRALAIVAGLLAVAALAGSLTGGILADLGNQFDRLRRDAPRAAAKLEESERFSEAATDFRLEERVEEIMERLRDPTSGLASEEAASAASAYLVGAVLTAFFLSSGPRMGQAALAQIRDPQRQERARDIVRLGFARGRTYLLFAFGRAAVAGLVTWSLCYLEDVPAPIVLGVAVAGLSIVPGFGIFFGGIFALLLEAGLGTPGGAVRLGVAFLLLQVADTLFGRWVVVPRSLSVGPAAIVIAVIVGFEVYGIGGAIYAAVLAVFGVAMLDAAGRLNPVASSEATQTPRL